MYQNDMFDMLMFIGGILILWLVAAGLYQLQRYLQRKKKTKTTAAPTKKTNKEIYRPPDMERLKETDEWRPGDDYIIDADNKS